MIGLQTHEAAGNVRHVSVLRDEAVDALAPVDGGVYVDGTFGAGGYSRAILDMADCRVVGIDRDEEAIRDGAPLVEQANGRLLLVQGRFGDLKEIVHGLGVDRVEGVVLDVGVSSMQLDSAERGFSFRFDGPLDMRMGREGPSAADLVNELPEKDLAALIRTLGEERRASAIAKAVVAERANGRIESTHAAREDLRGGDRPLAGSHQPGDPHLPGAAHSGERRARRTAAGIVRGGGGARARRPARGRQLPFARRPDRENLPGRAFAHHAEHFPPCPGDLRRIADLHPDHPLGHAGRRGNGAQSAFRSARLRAAERTEAPARGPAESLAYGVPHLPALAQFMARA